jgi:hypothetical protein
MEAYMRLPCWRQPCLPGGTSSEVTALSSDRAVVMGVVRRSQPADMVDLKTAQRVDVIFEDTSPHPADQSGGYVPGSGSIRETGSSG